MRSIPITEAPRGFTYVKSNETHDICVRRVGVYAGQCYKVGTKTCSPSSHYFIRLEQTDRIDEIMKGLNGKKYRDNTVGARSISKPEFNQAMNDVLRQLS
jgi:hypothetical protein